LHYTVVNGRLYFGSEIKSILEAPDVPRDLDLDALNHYLSFLYTPRDESIFRGIRKLPPGHFLTFTRGRVHVEQYWRQPTRETFRGSEAEAVSELDGILVDAVRSHLVSDVPLGAFLSGGVDSSLVVGLMAETSGGRVKTFSIGFDEASFDELEHARRVARHFGTDHHEFVVKPDAVEILDSLISHFDEPFGDSSAIPTWYVSEKAREHVAVVLSGDGGDERSRLRSLPSAPSGRRLRSLRPRHRSEGCGDRRSPAATRRPGKNFFRHVARDARVVLDAIGFTAAMKNVPPGARRRGSAERG
jgi:asparagine synthase (glutamine-hydrolysing)